jgi:LPS export ABC transporter protein LptC
MSRSRILLILLLLAAIAGGVLWGLRTVPSHPEREGEPAITIAGPVLTMFDEEGQRLWELEAGSITLDQEADRTLAEDVRLKFFQDGELALEVTAARLLLFNRSEEMELEGGIEARDDQGLRFHTERIRWDGEREVLVGDLEVEIRKGGNRLTGKGFEYWPKEGRFSIEEEAHLIISPKSKVLGLTAVSNLCPSHSLGYQPSAASKES